MATSNWTKRRKLKQELEQRIRKIEQNAQLESTNANSCFDSHGSSGVSLQTISVDELNARLTPREVVCSLHPGHHVGPNEVNSEIILDHVYIDSDVENAEMDSDCEISDEDESHEPVKLIDLLPSWAVRNGITQSAFKDLLAILHQFHPDLPKDPRTVLKVNVDDEVKVKAGGEYYHFGLA